MERKRRLLRDARDQLGITQTQLAERLDTSQSAVSRTEQHGLKTFTQASAHAAALEIELVIVINSDGAWVKTIKRRLRGRGDRHNSLPRARREERGRRHVRVDARRPPGGAQVRCSCVLTQRFVDGLENSER